MLTVDDYERIRWLIKREHVSQREVARRLGHSRHTIKKVLQDDPPGSYQRQKPFARPVIDPVKGLIDAWLAGDKKRHRKQRHTAQRIYDRLREEYNFRGSVSAVRRYVARQKARGAEVFFPLQFDPGEEAQVDWGEVRAIIGGVECKLCLFCVRCCHSTASFVRACKRENQESFLDGHVRAFEFFGGVSRQMAYDNLKTAVISVGKGQDRLLTKRFREIRSHYVFETRFCNVASGNEKGHVENLVKHAQRTFMTPLPEVASLEELNDYLLDRCQKDLDRIHPRQKKTRRELLEEEREHFLPLPKQPFEACKFVSTLATKQALLRFDTNDYSVPVEHAHQTVVVKAFVDRVELFMADEQVAVHQRHYGSGQYILDPYHYLSLLKKKPGGIHNGRPFKGEPWGPEFTRMRHELEYRYEGEGTRKFIEILLLFARFPVKDVKAAVRKCLKCRAFSDEAVFSVLTYRPHRRFPRLDLSKHPELQLSGQGKRPALLYDGLLERKGVAL